MLSPLCVAETLGAYGVPYGIADWALEACPHPPEVPADVLLQASTVTV
jgi:hypothetical protein